MLLMYATVCSTNCLLANCVQFHTMTKIDVSFNVGAKDEKTYIKQVQRFCTGVNILSKSLLPDGKFFKVVEEKYFTGISANFSSIKYVNNCRKLLCYFQTKDLSQHKKLTLVLSLKNILFLFEWINDKINNFEGHFL